MRHDEAVRAGLEVAVWTAVCFGVWVLTLSSVTWPDVAVGLPAAALTAGCAAVGRRLTASAWRLRPSWLRWCATLPVAIVADSVAVLLTAYRLRRCKGSTRIITLPGGEPAPLSEGRAAVGALALSASPASYVYDTEPRGRQLRVHSVDTQTPAWARVEPSEP